MQNYINFIFSGIVGETDDKDDSLYIWSHKKFEIGFNGKQVNA